MCLSLPTVCKAASLLKEAHCSRGRDAGVGVVFDLSVKKNVSCILMCYLMGVIDPATMVMDFGNGGFFESIMMQFITFLIYLWDVTLHPCLLPAVMMNR